MRRLAVAVSVMVLVAWTSAAPASPAEPATSADAATPCIQPVVRIAIEPTADRTNDGPMRTYVARGAIVTATGSTFTLKSDPSVAKGVTITTVDGKITIVADRVVMRTIAGTKQVFLYDRSGEACGLDQVPKELQPEL